MNKLNNKRARNTNEAIVRAAFELLVGQNRPMAKITVREICELAGINRSTFYAHYKDVYDLFEQVEERIGSECAETVMQYVSTGGIQGALEAMFAYVEGYKEFYRLYFCNVQKMSHIIEKMVEPFREQIENIKAKDMGYGVRGEMVYHFSFFTAGLGAMLAHWVNTGCQETPAELFEVLKREYGPNSLFNTWLVG